MYIKSRKIHTNKKVIDMPNEELPHNEKNDFSYNRISKKSSNEISVPALTILVIALSLISGCLGAYMMLNSFSSNVTTNNGITTSTTKLNEPNSISNAVSKVYDSVVVVEVYNNKQLVSTGTGFVYKKENGKAYLMTK